MRDIVVTLPQWLRWLGFMFEAGPIRITVQGTQHKEAAAGTLLMSLLPVLGMTVLALAAGTAVLLAYLKAWGRCARLHSPQTPLIKSLSTRWLPEEATPVTLAHQIGGEREVGVRKQVARCVCYCLKRPSC